MSIRQRETSSLSTISGRARTSGFTDNWQSYNYAYRSYSRVEDLSNAPEYLKLGSGDTGSPFFLDRVQYDIKPIVLNSGFAQGEFIGQRLSGQSYGSDLISSEDQVKYDGTRAIAIAAPTNPSMNLAATLGELKKDGIPAVLGSGLAREKTKFLKGASSEYLNVEFGWKPMIRDIIDFARIVKDADKEIASYRKGANEHTRRRHRFPEDSSFTIRQGRGYLSPPIRTRVFDGSMTESYSAQSWFSGAFKYYLPVTDDVGARLSRYSSYAGKLLGLRLTPDTLWELAPWSWAVDWHVDVGSVMTNISNFQTDGLVMQYGYAMRHVRHETLTNFTFLSSEGGGSGHFKRVHEQKRRVPASPFGFNIVPGELSNRQRALLVAVGISQGSTSGR